MVAFFAERALPSGVFGPVDFAAFALFASFCRAVPTARPNVGSTPREYPLSDQKRMRTYVRTHSHLGDWTTSIHDCLPLADGARRAGGSTDQPSTVFAEVCSPYWSQRADRAGYLMCATMTMTFPQRAGGRTLGPACVLLSRASNQLSHRCCCFGLHAWDHMGVLLQRERGGLVT